MKQLWGHSKGYTLPFVPAHPAACERIAEYLEAAGHRATAGGPLFRPVRNPGGTLDRPLTGAAVYASVVMHHAKAAGIDPPAINVHSLRTTAVTHALEHAADIAQVQAWCGHSSIATTKLYDRRPSRAEDSPTFKVAYWTDPRSRVMQPASGRGCPCWCSGHGRRAAGIPATWPQ